MDFVAIDLEKLASTTPGRKTKVQQIMKLNRKI